MRCFQKGYDREAEAAEAARLTQEHFYSGHMSPIKGCPICYNCAIVDERIAAGGEIVLFEHEGSLSPNEIGQPLKPSAHLKKPRRKR